MIKFLVAASLVALTRGFPLDNSEQTGQCGYDSCPVPVPGKINVHLVPHTHDDVGWLKTVDQYYFGSRTHTQNAGVQYIIDSVVNELFQDPKKKFIYVETAFFWKWWMEQEDHMRHRVKQLVKNGQLEFIGGAWSMNDEATTHYHSVIDQFTWGFRKLNDTFGKCGQPRIGWQIDPFGHSRETASMMAHFGFDGLFFGRLDYQDKMNRLEKNTMEMIWEGSSSLGTKGDLLTGALYNHYSAPPGFCFDVLCDDDPFVTNPNSPDFNVKEKVKKFEEFVTRQRSRFLTDNIILTMGDDFNYQDAHMYFKNLDSLIRYVNDRQKNGSNINVFYSTPSCYVKSLNQANATWPTKQDDFFPYASDPHAYWTGYFTSRPTLKYFERQGNNHLQICKQLSSMAMLGPEDDQDIDALREAMGVMQHHDAITGTEKQHVAHDYARILSNALGKCEIASNAALNKIMAKNNPPLTFTSCLLTNVSECAVSSNSDKFIATVYNPLSRPASLFVRLPVFGKSWSVETAQGEKVTNQIVPIPSAMVGMPGRASTTRLELVFKATDVPPLGYRSYYVTNLDHSEEEVPAEAIGDAEEIAIGDEDRGATVDATTGLLSSMTVGGKKVSVTQNLEYYIGAAGNNDLFENRASGAYVFRPKGNDSFQIAEKINVTVYKGPLVEEVHQVFSDWASQVVRHYVKDSAVEVEWLVGPIPIRDDDGKEIIARYRTDIDNGGLFYTDSNGRQTIERRRNYRPTWDLDLREPIAGNYYPITTDISIRNKEVELTLLTDRAHGGSSLKDGDMEVMLHRRLLWDDGFGVGEALNEEAFEVGLIVRGKQWLLLGNLSDPNWPKHKRLVQQEKVLSPQVLLTDAKNLDFNQWSKTYRTEYSGLTAALPPEVQILTLEPWKGRTFLLRLEHLLDKSESNASVTVNLNNLFSAFDIVSVRETSLGADRWLDEVSRLKWRKESNEVLESEDSIDSIQTSFPQVTLKPKEIRTFICDIRPKNSI